MRPLSSSSRWIAGAFPLLVALAAAFPGRGAEVPVQPLQETSYAIVYVEKASSDSAHIRNVQLFLAVHGLKPRLVDMATINPKGPEMRNLAIGTAGGEIQFPGVEINGRFFTTPWEAADQAAMVKAIETPFGHQAPVAAVMTEEAKPAGIAGFLHRSWYLMILLAIPLAWVGNEALKRKKAPVEGEEGEAVPEGEPKPEAPAPAPLATGVPDPTCHKVIFNKRECDYTVRAGNLYIAGMTFDLFGSTRPDAAHLVLASGTKLEFVYHEPPPPEASTANPNDTQPVAT